MGNALHALRRTPLNAIQVYPYTKNALYRLYAAPAQVTDIALEPGERLVSVSAGDTVRWVVGDSTSGEGKDAIVHIFVKPIGADEIGLNAADLRLLTSAYFLVLAAVVLPQRCAARPLRATPYRQRSAAVSLRRRMR
jgi:hypothetical protein